MNDKQAYDKVPAAQAEKSETRTRSAKPFETKHYIYGREVRDLDEHELMDALVQVKADINHLKAIGEGAESTHIKKRIGQYTVMLGKISDALDAIVD